MNTFGACRVGAGGDNTTTPGLPANSEGLAGQRGVVQFFAGAEESIEVKVEDLSRGHERLLESWKQFGTIVLSQPQKNGSQWFR